LVVNTPWSSEALDYIREAEDLRFGIHLNLTTGRPLLGPENVPTLVNASGNFHDMSVFLSRYFTGRLNFEELESELATQVERCLDDGVRPQHVDSHMHFHSLPALWVLVSRLAARYGIPAIRNPNLGAFIVPPFGKARRVQEAMRKTGNQILHSTQNAITRKTVLLDEPTINTEQLIYLRWYLESKQDPVLRFQECIWALDGRTLEIIAHPAVADEVLPTLSSYVDGRQRELDFLRSEQFAQILETL
jgi:predicted glycoside hydrolase/deacetylase ChbG (UPF0249 family)